MENSSSFSSPEKQEIGFFKNFDEKGVTLKINLGEEQISVCVKKCIHEFLRIIGKNHYLLTDIEEDIEEDIICEINPRCYCFDNYIENEVIFPSEPNFEHKYFMEIELNIGYFATIKTDLCLFEILEKFEKNCYFNSFFHLESDKNCIYLCPCQCGKILTIREDYIGEYYVFTFQTKPEEEVPKVTIEDRKNTPQSEDCVINECFRKQWKGGYCINHIGRLDIHSYSTSFSRKNVDNSSSSEEEDLSESEIYPTFEKKASENKKTKYTPGLCNRLLWKGTTREHVCGKEFYSEGMCYYHWKKRYPTRSKLRLIHFPKKEVKLN